MTAFYEEQIKFEIKYGAIRFDVNLMLMTIGQEIQEPIMFEITSGQHVLACLNMSLKACYF